MKGVSIKYGDIAPEAKENFSVDTDDKASFVNLTQLNVYNLDVKNYGNPCEQYSVLLDSTAVIPPEYPEYEDMGYWSESVSSASKNFDIPIVIELTSGAGNYTSKGLTFTFDTFNDIFCNSLNIKWYQDETLLADVDFQPTSAFFFCEKEVEYFNKVVITFYSMNMAYQRLKIRSIDYGHGTYFYGDELKNVNVIQEIDPVSREIMINVVDFTLDSKRENTTFNFQQKQPLSIYFNGELIQTQFVDTSKRAGQKQWEIQTNDYIGYLDKITFLGGIYTNKNAVELLESISTQTNIPFDISEDLNDITVSGYIPICTCREAIQHIAFACVKRVDTDENNHIIKSCVVDTSGSDKVKFYMLDENISQVIPLSRIRQGQSFETSDRTTGVEITQYDYKKPTADTEYIELFNNEEQGQTGNKILVTFSNPVDVDTLIITNGTFYEENGTQLKGNNYAYINAQENCILQGKEYIVNTMLVQKDNPNILASDVVKIESITDETLVSANNVDNIKEKCYNHYVNNTKVNVKIEQGKHGVKYGELKYSAVKYGQYLYDAPVNVGEMITSETQYLGTLTGRILSASFNLNGSIIVKECEMI